MEQKFEGTPSRRDQIERPTGHAHRRDGKVVATANARAQESYEITGEVAGSYEIVLQMWRYIDYRKKPDGEFVNSKFIDISNKLTLKI